MTEPEDDWDARFNVGFDDALARDGGEWAVYVTANIDQCVTVVYDEDSAVAVTQMERFVARAQEALAELRRSVAADPPPSCRPDHAEPEELSLGFGGITYRCLQCGAEWFRPIRPGEPV